MALALLTAGRPRRSGWRGSAPRTRWLQPRSAPGTSGTAGRQCGWLGAAAGAWPGRTAGQGRRTVARRLSRRRQALDRAGRHADLRISGRLQPRCQPPHPLHHHAPSACLGEDAVAHSAALVCGVARLAGLGTGHGVHDESVAGQAGRGHRRGEGSAGGGVLSGALHAHAGVAVQAPAQGAALAAGGIAGVHLVAAGQRRRLQQRWQGGREHGQ